MKSGLSEITIDIHCTQGKIEHGIVRLKAGVNMIKLLPQILLCVQRSSGITVKKKFKQLL